MTETGKFRNKWALRIGATAAITAGIVGLVEDGISSAETSPACSPKTIVVLGSSTAAGVGAQPLSDSWVSRYERENPKDTIVNLAVSGYTTYQVLPDGAAPPIGRPGPDSRHNISAALALEPDGIIINLPSNDIANGFTLNEVESNFKKIKQAADEEAVPTWISTTQPRNFSEEERKMLLELKGWVQEMFPTKSLDFWTGVANPDGTQNSAYAVGDGIHLNSEGHKKLAEVAGKSGITKTLCEFDSTGSQR